MARHNHKCDGCGTVWNHDTKDLMDQPEYDTAHNCPGCGAQQFRKHFTSKEERDRHIQQCRDEENEELLRIMSRPPEEATFEEMMFVLSMVLKHR